MRRASVREFRAHLADLIEQDEPITITRHGRAAAVVYPLKNIRHVPAEVRRDLVEAAARDFGVEQPDEVIERSKSEERSS